MGLTEVFVYLLVPVIGAVPLAIPTTVLLVFTMTRWEVIQPEDEHAETVDA